MKFCELRFALLFFIYFCGIHGRSSYYETEIEPVQYRTDVEEEEELHVHDPEVVSLSTLAMNQLNQEKLEDDDPLFLLEIVKAATQAVSGNSTLLTLKVSQGGVNEMCEIKILKEPSSHKMELVHSKCGTVPAKYESLEAVTGDLHRDESHDGESAVEELDVDNAQVIRLSTIAVDEMNKEIVNENDTNNLLEIVRASVVAVSGKMANLNLSLIVSQGYVIKTCVVTIQHHIWLNETKVVEYECDESDETVVEASNESYDFSDDYDTEDSVNYDSLNKTFALTEKEPEAVIDDDDDDEVDLNVNDPEVITLSSVSLIELNAEKQEDDPPFYLLEVDKAVLHKSSGEVTLILEVSQGDAEDTCEINLWQDSVIDKLDITHSKCGTVPAKNKPQNTNKEDEVNVNDPEVNRLSVIALVSLNEHINPGDDPIYLLKIIKVSRHIDSRISTTMTLKVSQGRDEKMCNVKIVEKKMSHIPQLIDSSCELINHDEIDPVDQQVTTDPPVQDTVVHVSDETYDNYSKVLESLTFEDEEEEREEEEEELDVNDPEVINLSTLAMVTLNDEKLEEDDPLILLDIIKAATHPSSGNSVSLTLEISQGGIEHVCELEFFHLFDTAESDIKHSKCGTVPATFKTVGGEPAPSTGGVEELEVTDPKVIRLSMIGLVELYEKYPTQDPINILEIVKASQQLVSGVLTNLTLKVSQGGRKKICDVQILEQAWLNITKITRAECDAINEKDPRVLEIYGINGLSKIIPLSK